MILFGESMTSSLLQSKTGRSLSGGPRSGSLESPVASHQSRILASSAPLRGASHELPVTDFPWRVGQSVTHARFGAGVIVNAEGRGADARVQVNFKGSGLKWLMLEYAKLVPA